jgi:hypothetical protein
VVLAAQLDRCVLGHRLAGFVDAAGAAEDETGQNERLGARPAVHEATVEQQLVGAALGHSVHVAGRQRAVGALDDGGDAGFGLGELGLAVAAQGGAALIGADRVLQLLLAALEAAHDLFEFGQRFLERQRADVLGWRFRT